LWQIRISDPTGSSKFTKKEKLEWHNQDEHQALV
jgi:hypothetical protein